MRKIFIQITTLCLAVATASAQNTDEKKAVEAVIRQLFKGLEKGDSAMVRTTFTEEVSLATVYRTPEGAPVLHRENSMTDFLKAVGSPHPETWYEEIWNLTIQIDGDLAHAWCDYAFYAGKNFSHCGVDAFQLHKGENGWKIFHLADTRRKAGCNVPKEIQNKHR